MTLVTDIMRPHGPGLVIDAGELVITAIRTVREKNIAQVLIKII